MGNIRMKFIKVDGNQPTYLNADHIIRLFVKDNFVLIQTRNDTFSTEYYRENDSEELAKSDLLGIICYLNDD